MIQCAEMEHAAVFWAMVLVHAQRYLASLTAETSEGRGVVGKPYTRLRQHCSVAKDRDGQNVLVTFGWLELTEEKIIMSLLGNCFSRVDCAFTYICVGNRYTYFCFVTHLL